MGEFEDSYNEAIKNIDRAQQQEDRYSWDITKYFDRINDKLFTINTIYIAAYLALIALKPAIPKSILFLPILISLVMIYIDWLMMESYRRMSKLMSMSPESIDKETDKMNNINLIAFLPILGTIFQTCLFIYYVS